MTAAVNANVFVIAPQIFLYGRRKRKRSNPVTVLALAVRVSVARSKSHWIAKSSRAAQ